MRKFFIFVAFIICFIMVGFCKYDAVNFSLNECANPKYYFYVCLNNAEQEGDSHFIKNGTGGIITLNQNELKMLNKFSINKVYGKSVEFEASEQQYKNFLQRLNFTTVKVESFNSLSTIYGYSDKFGERVLLYGKKVNIQIAKRGNSVCVGFPLILGSY